jgi:TonB family protein
MDNLLLYLLKVAAGTILLYLGYVLFFSKDTFYIRNRVLLILTLILPTFLPLIRIPITSYSSVPVEPVSTIENFVLPGTSFETVTSLPATSFDYYSLLAWIYLIMAGLVLLRGVISVISTYRIIKKGEINANTFPRVVVSDNRIPPFSFFSYAVIPEDQYKNGNYRDILDHEFAHIRQGHTFDLLLSELFIAFQWFNPFVWLIKRSIILNHEYLADHVSLGNKSAKEYQYRLLNFQTELKHVSLAHNFNSLIKNRIIMINKKPTNKYAMTKNLLILPIVAIVAYAFATPEYRYVSAAPKDNSLTLFESAAIVQQEVKGIVLKEDGKPLSGVLISRTGTTGEATGTETGSDGKFSFVNVKSDAFLMFSCRGYKGQSLKPVFGSEMVVKMEIDPAYKPQPVTVMTANGTQQVSGQRPQPIVVIDGVISDKSLTDARKDLGYDMGVVKQLMGKEATDKYGTKGNNGVFEITTRKKALAMGLKPPFPRLAPADYPTFQNKNASYVSEWTISHLEYPAEAKTKKLEGWVQLNFRVELDGSVTNIVSTIPVDKILSDEVIKVVESAPKWDKPKNQDVDEPYNSSIIVRFKLPDQVLNGAPYVIVEKMPNYPGGDKELMKFINDNIKYPEDAKAENIQGRVILRFVVNTEGKAEAVSVLKGVHPKLDAEAVRVISLLNGWTPGMQGGKPVNVWYSIPVTFNLDAQQIGLSQTSWADFYKFVSTNIIYPQMAMESSDTGRIYVLLKLAKGGVIKECKVIEDRNAITVPVINETVIVGYRPTGETSAANSAKPGTNEHLALKNECLRVANKLTVNEIPEWKDKDIEFALPFKFILR